MKGSAVTPTRRKVVDGESMLTFDDLRLLAKLPISVFIAWLLPPRYWMPIGSMIVGLDRHSQHQLSLRIGQVLGALSTPEQLQAVVRRHLTEIRLDQLAYLRSNAPGGWRPELILSGAEHLDTALARGAGVVLWIAPTVAAPLVAKMALHRHGTRAHHLSHPFHGLSSRTWLGRRVLNRLRTRVEDRYLAERVQLGRSNESFAALRRLAALLTQGRVVSVSVGRQGSRVAMAPFLDGRLHIASGAPALAARTGAALLPAMAWRTGPNAFTTRIYAPLTDVGDLDAVASAFARELATLALEHPDQIHWNHNSIQPTTSPAQ